MDSRKIRYIEETFSIVDLTRSGFLKAGMSYEDIDLRICTFFGITHIYMFDTILDDSTEMIIADLDTFSIN